MFAVDPARGLEDLARAWDQLLAAADVLGTYLTWCTSIEIAFFTHDLKTIGHWLQLRRHLRRGALETLPAACRERYVAASYIALSIVRPGDPEIDQLEVTAFEIIESRASLEVRLLLGMNIIGRATWHGTGRHRGARVYDGLKAAAETVGASAVTRYGWYSYAGQYHYWYAEDLDRPDIKREFERWKTMARDHGLHHIEFAAAVSRVERALADGDVEAARMAVETLNDVNRPLSMNDRAFAHFLNAWYCRTTGDDLAARDHAEAALRISELEGLVHARIHTLAILGVGPAPTARQALPLLALSRRLARQHGMASAESLSLIGSAIVALDYRRPKYAIRFAREALAIGARERIVRLPGVTRSDLERVCALALEHDIETEYVRWLIRVRDLAPPADWSGAWPSAVAVRCLGTFEITCRDEPVSFGRKAPRKPLELLKMLLAHQGRIPESRLIARLWPGGSRETSRGALATTVHRLRGLIGEKALRVADDHVSLDPARVGVDAWSFETLFAKAEREPDTVAREALFARAVALYEGDFLPGEDQSWAVSARERLRARFVRAVGDLARMRRQRGDWRGALDWCQRGLEVDPLFEEFHAGVIDAYAALDSRAGALAAYRRYQRTFAKLLGVAPSKPLQARLRALMGD